MPSKQWRLMIDTLTRDGWVEQNKSSYRWAPTAKGRAFLDAHHLTIKALN